LSLSQDNDISKEKLTLHRVAVLGPIDELERLTMNKYDAEAFLYRFGRRFDLQIPDR
jgi:hypothetical protein